MGILFGLKIASLFILGLLIWWNLIWFRNFSRLLRTPVTGDFPDSELPRTLVILCLRGSDPFLRQTLSALTQQTYQNFDLRVVIDHPADSSAAVVRQFQEETGFDRLQLRYLHRRRRTCSLKVSALLQELTHLDSSYKVVVQLDADAVPYPGWLAEMVTPLRDPQVGATSGLRWYMPYKSNWASLLRYVWGISGTVQMHQFGMPWGGSLAFRRELLTRTRLLKLWRHSLTDDLVFDGVLQQSGLRLQFVPAVMVNREETNLKDCYSFVQRQILLARHYHSQWRSVASFAFLNGACFVTSVLFNAIGDHSRSGLLYWAGWIGMLSYLITYSMLVARAEQIVRRKVLLQGGAVTPIDYRYILVQPAALMMHMVATASALLCRHVNWRGVAYQVSRGGRVKVLRDEPYLQDSTSQASIV